jgi:transposase
MEQERKLARERASIILQVRMGAITATEGAERLGVSRKTYYEWEDRALEAMALALENHPPGRPPTPLDAEKEELQTKIRDLEKKLYLAEKTIEVRDLLSAYETFRAGGSKKNKGEKQKAGKRRSVE